MRQQLALAGDDERVTVIADADPIDHPPQRFEVQPADQKSSTFAVVHPHRDDGRRQEVVIEREPRHQRAFDADAVRAGNGRD